MKLKLGSYTYFAINMIFVFILGFIVETNHDGKKLFKNIFKLERGNLFDTYDYR